MDSIDEMLLKSSIKTEILQIAYNLQVDNEHYTIQSAINDLLKIIDRHDL